MAIHRILCPLLKNKLMFCCPVLVSVSGLGEFGEPNFHSRSVRCLSVFISSLQMCFTSLLLFIQSLKRCGLLFVLVFKLILESGLFRDFKRVLKVLLTHYFIA